MATFGQLNVGDYFFVFHSTVPFYKVSETHYIEGGSVVHIKMNADQRIVPITIVWEDTPYEPRRATHIRIGYYSIPLIPPWTGRRMVAENSRVAATKGPKKYRQADETEGCMPSLVEGDEKHRPNHE